MGCPVRVEAKTKIPMMDLIAGLGGDLWCENLIITFLNATMPCVTPPQR